MRIAVLGGQGNLGAAVCRHVRAAGHEATALGRSTGIDARTGSGLSEAFERADVVVDCLNVTTMRARAAIDFFAGSAEHVVRAAREAGTNHMVVVSIAGASDPAVHRRHGYYRGKAAQESVYLDSGLPVTMIHSTQWFDLVDDMVAMVPTGPLAFLPRMRMAAVSPDSVAALVARVATEPPIATSETPHTVAIRGPEVATGAQWARRILAARGSVGGRRPRVILDVPGLGSAIARDGLIPGEALVDPVTAEEWVARAMPPATHN